MNISNAIRNFVILSGLVVTLAAAGAQYAGNYEGTYSGDESGTWEAVADSSGVISAEIMDPFGDVYSGEGSVNATGGFFIGFADTGASFKGQIDNTGRISGTWQNPSFRMHGSFSGRRTSIPSTPPTITTASPLPSGTVDEPYNRILKASGGLAPYVWEIVSGDFPTSLDLSLDGVISGTPDAPFTGTFTVQVTGDDGLFSAKDFKLTIKPAPSPPAIMTADPLPAGFVGKPYNLTLTATAGQTPYRWSLVSGHLPPGLTLSSGGVISRIPTAAGLSSFTVRVTGADGASSTQDFSLSVDALPSLTIVYPTASLRVSNELFSVRGTASDNSLVAAVYCQIRGEWFLAETTNDWTNWTATLNLVPGTNLVRAYAWDDNGGYSRTSSVSIVYVQMAPLVVQTNGDGSVSPSYDGVLLEVGKSYTITAKPAPGYLFAGWTGDIESSSQVLKFTMQSHLGLAANFIPNPFNSVAGTYQGLFFDTHSPAVESSGFITASPTTKGTFSAKLNRAGKSIPFSGQFTLSGFASNYVLLAKTNAMTVLMQLDMARGDALSGVITGSNWTASLNAYRGNRYPHTNSARYTLLIAGSDDSTAVPGGEGFGTVSVTAAGNATFSGSLADGTTASSTAAGISQAGLWPLCVSLYSGKGVILGWLAFSNEMDSDISGQLTWIKQSQSGSKYYSAGFTNQSEALGSFYVVTNGPVLNLSTGQVWLAEGNLPAAFTNQVVLGANNKVTSTNKGLVLTLTPAKGLFQGSVINPYTNGVPKTLSFKGAVLQKQNYASGFFLGTNQSGRVVLQRP